MVEEGLRRPAGQAMGPSVAVDVGVVGSGRGDRTSLSSHDGHDFFQSRDCSVGWEKTCMGTTFAFFVSLVSLALLCLFIKNPFNFVLEKLSGW